MLELATLRYTKKNCPLWTFTSYIPSVSFSIAWKLSGGLLSEKEQLSHKLKDCTQELWRVADHPNTFQRNPKIPVVYFMICDSNWIWYLQQLQNGTWSWNVHFSAISLSEMKDLLKVRLCQNEFMKSSIFQISNSKIRSISALKVYLKLNQK